MDFRLKILATIIIIAALATVAYFAHFFWATCAKCQFGDPANWPEHISDANNLSFQYPPGFDVIVPEDEANNPVSIVKKGERGESVLMQVGTWHADKTFANTDELAQRYQAAVSRRKTLSTEKFAADGRDGILFVQDEPSGRRIIEAFLLDASTGAEGEVLPREISLQLPGDTPAIKRELYQRTFRGLLGSVHFLHGRSAAVSAIPDGIPAGWEKYTSSQGGYSFWKPHGWSVTHEAQEEGGIYAVVLQPSGSANNNLAYDSGQETAFVIHAWPKDLSVLLSDLDITYAQPFRDSVDKDSLEEERFTFPGFGPGISLQGHKAASEGKPAGLVYLVVMTAVGENPEMTPSRGYVLSAFLPDGDTQKENEDFIRRITQSLKPLNG